MTAIVIQQLDFVMEAFPIVRYLLAAFFVLRVLNKTVFAALKKYVELTPEIEDNEHFKRITGNKYYKIFAFVLDMTASVKLPKSKVK